jgi:tripartite-type tricarboxylate transporter receptor subunit TctC
MNRNRRFLMFASLAATLAVASPISQAQAFPERPITMIVS